MWLLLAAVIMPRVGAAEVKLKIMPDGSRMMYNDGPARHRAQRSTAHAGAASVTDFRRIVDSHAKANRLDPKLVRAVISVESAFQPAALSDKGAMGLMQLMPETAETLAVEDPWDPDANIAGGAKYLRQLLDRFDGSLELALAGYNAGPEAVVRYGGIPPYTETQDYVEKVLRLYRGDPNFRVARSSMPRIGRKTYLRTDEDGRYILTTSPGTDP